MLQLTVNTPKNIVQIERVILNEKMLLVSSTATDWVNQYHVAVNAKELLARYQRVIRSAKAAGANRDKKAYVL